MQGSMKLVILIYFHLTHVLTMDTFPDRCICDKNILKCTRLDIPEVIPVNTSNVYITNCDFDRLDTWTFDHASWESVILLDLHALQGVIIRGRCFSKLNHLEHLGVHGDNLWTLDSSTFVGLDRVRTLDVSNNVYLKLDELILAFDGTTGQVVLPSLKNLTFSKLNSLQTEPVNLDYKFMRSVSAGRALVYLDFSFTNVGVFDYSQIYLLCDSITYIRARGTVISYPKDFYTAPDCKSFRTLDITDTLFPVANQNLTFEFAQFTCATGTAHSSIETLIASGVFKGEIYIDSYHLDMTGCDFHMKKIIFRRNNVKHLNMTVTLPEIMKSSISELNLSENDMEYIAPETIYQSESLQILQLSKNRLYKMQVKHLRDFGRLLHNSWKLREFYIAENNMAHIPEHFFESNENLEYIDMSNNELQSLAFNMFRLKNLRYLDLSHNRIKVIDKFAYMTIDGISKEIAAERKQQTMNSGNITDQHTSTIANMQTNDVSFQVNLGNNPYECSCDEETYISIEWLQTSTTVCRQNVTYVCEFHGENLDMLSSVTDVIKTKCAYQHLMNILKAVIPSSLTVVALVIVVLIVWNRRRRKDQLYQDFVNQLSTGDFDKKYLAFLSFCSEDNDFVLNHISSQLQSTLSESAHTDRNLICVGDKEFRLGLQVHAEVMRCMKESSVAVFIVSKTFCKKSWCQMEVGEAYDQRKPILMLMKEFVDVDDMPKVLGRIFKRYTHASWVNDENGGHLEPDMKIISKSIIELARKNTKHGVEPDQSV